ncbi:hypothetical protein HGM15179_009171 [Zosterops borbonicus]|uniref:Uncharacterized protein n=1 Tax=Zosterops borbonicus TaxID=364589 RepID=A0A8K1GHP0_9PASS|nr:hypothetical protein HGM15179_009171 [Zosterops borbonicus]
MKFNKAKLKVLHMCQSNLKQKYRLGREWLESSPEDDLELLVEKKLRKTQQCALAAHKTTLDDPGNYRLVRLTQIPGKVMVQIILEANGMEWNGTERNGTEQNRTERNGTERNGTE